MHDSLFVKTAKLQVSPHHRLYFGLLNNGSRIELPEFVESIFQIGLVYFPLLRAIPIDLPSYLL